MTADMRLHLSQFLANANDAVENWPLGTLTPVDIAARLARGYRAMRRSVPANWLEADGETLHELRKRVVAHRYQMEITVPLWRRLAKMWIGEAQRLRERLGKHQDLLVLLRLVEANAPLARWRTRLEPAIEQRKEDHVRGARRIAARLLIEKPSHFRRRMEMLWEQSR